MWSEIRLARHGSAKKNPIYRVVVADSRVPRDGRSHRDDRSLQPAARSVADRDRHRPGARLARKRRAADRTRSRSCLKIAGPDDERCRSDGAARSSCARRARVDNPDEVSWSVRSRDAGVLLELHVRPGGRRQGDRQAGPDRPRAADGRQGERPCASGRRVHVEIVSLTLDRGPPDRRGRWAVPHGLDGSFHLAGHGGDVALECRARGGGRRRGRLGSPRARARPTARSCGSTSPPPATRPRHCAACTVAPSTARSCPTRTRASSSRLDLVGCARGRAAAARRRGGGADVPGERRARGRAAAPRRSWCRSSRTSCWTSTWPARRISVREDFL